MSTQQTTPDSAALMERVELIKAELDQVLQSPGFRRSERHSRFLRFVCESTLGGEASRLNEYLIAHRVFDRGSDYSPGEDSVVRRQAYSVRQKLQEYYAAEGRNNGVRIELPVGRYVPSFNFAIEPVPRASISPVVQPPEEPAAATVLPSTTARNSAAKWAVLAGVAALICGIGGYVVGSHSRQMASLDPVFGRIWGPWLSDSEGSVICFSNALTAGIRRTDEPFPEENLTRGIALRAEEADRIREQFHLAPGGFFYMNPAMAHAKMGEALGSIPLTAMFTKAGVPVRATESRHLNWQDFRNQNLILLGHDEANQWLDPILSKLPFRLARTRADKPRRIVISDPRPDERSEYYPDYSKGQNPAVEDYALISLLSGIDGHHGLALVNGVNTEGTMMGLEYLTEPVTLRSLQTSLQKANPRHSGPWHFQVILHCELRDGVPVGIELVAMRQLP